MSETVIVTMKTVDDEGICVCRRAERIDEVLGWDYALGTAIARSLSGVTFCRVEYVLSQAIEDALEDRHDASFPKEFQALRDAAKAVIEQWDEHDRKMKENVNR